MAAKRYRAFFIEPGLVDYTENGHRETVLVQRPALEKMRPSFIGKPIFNFEHKDINPDDAFDVDDQGEKIPADGVIADVGYDAESGYDFADMVIWNEETQRNIDEEGYSVSCAYIPTDSGPGGTHNSVPFDEEVLDGEYHHMAIVDAPRYEGSRIIANSKEKETMKFRINLGKKRQNAEPPAPAPEEEVVEVPAEAMVEVNGEMVPVAELVENYRNKKNADDGEPADNASVLNMDDTVEIDGVEVPVSELVDNYCGPKENAESPTDTELEDPVKENTATRKNAEDPEPEKPAKKNENFRKLENAASRGGELEKPEVNTRSARFRRGAERYGVAGAVKEAK